MRKKSKGKKRLKKGRVSKEITVGRVYQGLKIQCLVLLEAEVEDKPEASALAGILEGLM